MELEIYKDQLTTFNEKDFKPLKFKRIDTEIKSQLQVYSDYSIIQDPEQFNEHC